MHELIDGVAATYAELRAATIEYYEAEIAEGEAERKLKVEIHGLYAEGLITGKNDKERDAQVYVNTRFAQESLAKASADLARAKLRLALADLAKEKLQMTLSLQSVNPDMY
jgi:hypothetical protein